MSPSPPASWPSAHFTSDSSLAVWEGERPLLSAGGQDLVLTLLWSMSPRESGPISSEQTGRWSGLFRVFPGSGQAISRQASGCICWPRTRHRLGVGEERCLDPLPQEVYFRLSLATHPLGCFIKDSSYVLGLWRWCCPSSNPDAATDRLCDPEQVTAFLCHSLLT